jgi:signal transduction histidine kinase
MPPPRSDAHLPNPRVPTRPWLIAVAAILAGSVLGGIGLTHTIDRVNGDRLDVQLAGFEEVVADQVAGLRIIGFVLPLALDAEESSLTVERIVGFLGESGAGAALIGAFPLDGFGGLGFVDRDATGALAPIMLPNAYGLTNADLVGDDVAPVVRAAIDEGRPQTSGPIQAGGGTQYAYAVPTGEGSALVEFLDPSVLFAGPTERDGVQILRVVATDILSGEIVAGTGAMPEDSPYRSLELALLGRSLRVDVWPGQGFDWQTGWVAGTAAAALGVAIAALVYLIGIVSRRRSMEQSERLRLAREINEDKDHFIAAVSHELRTPLTSVLGLAEELTAGMADFEADQVHELVAIMAQESSEVALLVEDLLVAARAEEGSVVIRPEIVDVDLQVARVCASLDPTSGIRVQRSGVSVWADPLRLRQILRNLITNAVRHGGDHVVVDARTDGRRTTIEVRDDGVGIRGEAHARMFEPYYKSAVVRGQAPSVGLGLTVSYQLAQLMDGELSYEYKDGWGRFRLEFPAVMVGTPRVQRLAEAASD